MKKFLFELSNEKFFRGVSREQQQQKITIFRKFWVNVFVIAERHCHCLTLNSRKTLIQDLRHHACSAKRIDDVYARITINISAYSMRNFSLIDVFSTQFAYNQIFIDNLHIQSDTERYMTRSTGSSEKSVSTTKVLRQLQSRNDDVVSDCFSDLFPRRSQFFQIVSGYLNSPPRWAIKIVSLLPF